MHAHPLVIPSMAARAIAAASLVLAVAAATPALAGPHVTTAAAVKAADEGEVLFQQKNYPGAREKFALAVRHDPLWAEPVLLVGDTYFMEGNMAQAEQHFRRATEIDPQYSAAWRFLSDALASQGQAAQAKSAVLNALAAMPSEKESWQRLRKLAGATAQPLGTFKLVQRMSATASEVTMNIDVPVPASDQIAWMAYGLSLSAEKEKRNATAFAIDYGAWEGALEILAQAGKSDTLTEQGLRDMVRFHKAGQLKAAMFTVLYREAYRAEFEAWKRAEPDGIKRFIDTFNVGL